MQVTDDLIRSVVQEVLGHMKAGARRPPAKQRRPTSWGVFDDVDEAVAAANAAQRKFETRGLDDRKKARRLRPQDLHRARPRSSGREELEETKIGRLEHKIEKLNVAGERTPGVEFLKTDAFAGEQRRRARPSTPRSASSASSRR